MPSQRDLEEAQLWETLRKELDKVRRKGFYEFRVASDCPTLGRLCREPGRGETEEDVIREWLMVLLDPDPMMPSRANSSPIAGRNRRDEGVTNRIVFGQPTSAVAIPRRDVDTIPNADKGTSPEIVKTFTPSKYGVGDRNKYLKDLRDESSLDKIQGSPRPTGWRSLIHKLLDSLADQIVADTRDAENANQNRWDQATDDTNLENETAQVPSLPVPNVPSQRSSRRFRRLAAIVLPIGLAACAVVVVLVGSRGHGPLADTPIRKEDCESQLAAADQDGAGQLEFGDFVRASTGGKFDDTVTADPGSRVAIKLRLSNVGPSKIGAVCVSATLPESATTSPSVSVTASSLPTAIPDNPSDTASIITDPAQLVCLALVEGSTEFMDRNGAVIESLPDDILDGGVRVGPLDVPLSAVRYVQFYVSVTPSEEKASCDVHHIA